MAKVTVHALDSGHLTLPERFFVDPNDPEARRFAPSLSFLIQHTDTNTNNTTRLLFDLGLRRDLDLYPQEIAEHCKNRERTETRPDVLESLAKGGLSPSDIDYVILSHMHYDHVGYPKDFNITDPTRTKFIIGPGARDVLSGKVRFRGTHSIFEPDLLETESSIELPPPEPSWDQAVDPNLLETQLNLSRWSSQVPPFRHVLDIFRDSSVYIVNAPGHLPGHINLLCRVSGDSPVSDPGAKVKYVLLAGDSCHDLRLIDGTHDIATWTDDDGHKCCIHTDIPAAKEHIQTIKTLRDKGLSLVVPGPTSETKGKGTGKYMTIGDKLVEIQKGWFGDPKAQEPGRMDQVENEQDTRSSRVHADVEVILAHDEVWEKDAKARNRFWPGQI